MDITYYDIVRLQLEKLFELSSLIKRLSVTTLEHLDKFIQGYYDEEQTEEVEGLYNPQYQREYSNPTIQALFIIHDLINLTLELSLEEPTFLLDETGKVNVDKDINQLLFSNNSTDENMKLKEGFINYHIDRLKYINMNEFSYHDLNIEDWLIMGENQVGLYLDNEVYHHYGCLIPEQILKHLYMHNPLPLSTDVELRLFFKKKYYHATLTHEDNYYMLYWDNQLRRRINKKFPDHFGKTNTEFQNQRVLMTFLYHPYYDSDTLKIDFEIVNM